MTVRPILSQLPTYYFPQNTSYDETSPDTTLRVETYSSLSSMDGEWTSGYTSLPSPEFYLDDPKTGFTLLSLV